MDIQAINELKKKRTGVKGDELGKALLENLKADKNKKKRPIPDSTMKRLFGILSTDDDRYIFNCYFHINNAIIEINNYFSDTMKDLTLNFSVYNLSLRLYSARSMLYPKKEKSKLYEDQHFDLMNRVTDLPLAEVDNIRRIPKKINKTAYEMLAYNLFINTVAEAFDLDDMDCFKLNEKIELLLTKADRINNIIDETTEVMKQHKKSYEMHYKKFNQYFSGIKANEIRDCYNDLNHLFFKNLFIHFNEIFERQAGFFDPMQYLQACEKFLELERSDLYS